MTWGRGVVGEGVMLGGVLRKEGERVMGGS